jgi:hypothetical protein
VNLYGGEGEIRTRFDTPPLLAYVGQNQQVRTAPGRHSGQCRPSLASDFDTFSTRNLSLPESITL